MTRTDAAGTGRAQAIPGAIPLPLPDGDIFGIHALLTSEERAEFDRLRAFFQSTVRPAGIAHWKQGTFPSALVPLLAEQGVARQDAPGRLLAGLLTMELARADTSTSIFVAVHRDLFTAAIRRLGSVEQRDRFLPALADLSTIGAFALTEPDHGSDISRGMTTTATRSGDSWTIQGQKRWIGNGTIADVVLVWARDTASQEILGFLVEADRPGVSRTLIDDKISVRSVQNADIALDAVVIPDANRLPGAQTFRDTESILLNSRVVVGWQAVGQQFAALDVARRYTSERIAFGRPLAAKQLVQEQLVRMLGNATMSLALMIQVARSQAEETVTMEQAALAKAMCSLRMRETVALGRSLLGGNGISSSYEMAKIFADAEAIYTYEGSYEINALLVGRSLTGISAFA
ncbi:acyl-CoA dehydrogenase family protein [Streptosporangium sp. NPDC006013]|uniref:acyl-CoA dehydrogenase family protein n=1 Tax=Streptosporangium sp. NPDC006013 TaxID=3155596 RepID=UPI0033BEBDDC